MNISGNGRWGRYRADPKTGELQKKCNGLLHPEGGAWLPLSEYFIFKKGKKKGKPLSRCKECERYDKYGERNHGLVYFARVAWIFHELERRLGRAETLRRVGVSQNFWMRFEKGTVTKLNRSTVARAMAALIEARAKNEVRHRDSIRHGAAQRGRKEKVVVEIRDLYKPHGDYDTEMKRRRVRVDQASIRRLAENNITGEVAHEVYTTAKRRRRIKSAEGSGKLAEAVLADALDKEELRVGTIVNSFGDRDPSTDL